MDPELISPTLLVASSAASALACVGRLYAISVVYRQGSQLPGPCQPVRVRYRSIFLCTVSCHAIISLVIIPVYGVLAFIHRDIWHDHASVSIVILSMIGQCCWMAGVWFPGQWAFHPLAMTCMTLLCSVGFLAGSILIRIDNVAGAIVQVVAAGVYRLWLLSQWAVFVWQNKGGRYRLGGNTFSNTSRIHRLLCQLLVQITLTCLFIAACALTRTYIESGYIYGPIKLYISTIIPALYAFHDITTEMVFIVFQSVGALRALFRPVANASMDGLELLSGVSGERAEEGNVSRQGAPQQIFNLPRV